MNLRPASALLLPILLLVASGHAHARVNDGQVSIRGLRPPTTVAAVIRRWGKPEAVESTSEGRWYRWRLPAGAGVLLALSDDAGDAPDYGAAVDTIEHLSGRKQTPTIFGFVFNKTLRRQVEERFRGSIKQCGGNFREKHGLALFQGPRFVYFFFSPKDRLIGVAQSTVNLDAAD